MILAAVPAFVGCAKNDDSKANASDTAAEAETRLFGRTEEPEWAPVDCDIALSSGGTVYAQNADFPTFAIVGTNSDNGALVFIVEQTAAAVLSASAVDADSYILTVNGEDLSGSVSFNDGCTEMTFKGDCSYTELCEIASVIRGL